MSSSDTPTNGEPASGLQLLHGTGAFFPALVHDIDAAQRAVRLETYIFDVSGGGAEVAAALERAAQRGVHVCVMVDGFGTPGLSGNWLQRLQAAGVHWQVFAPLGRWWFMQPTMWRRLHRKLVAIDGRVAYCGGINVLDDFHDPNHGALQEPRFDFSVRITGALVADVQEVMVQLWERTCRSQAIEDTLREGMHAPRPAGPVRRAVRRMKTVVDASRQTGAVLRGAVSDWLEQAREQARARHWPQPHALRAQLVLRDNWRHRNRIERAYLGAIRSAQREVVIANAYFVPGRALQKALIRAARRGVRVQLLLQGRYEYFMQYYASRPVYASLLQAGVAVHEYAASFLHAKVAVVDGEWATVGSSNLDPLSLMMAREANVVTRNAPFANELRQQVLDAMERGGSRMDIATFERRPWLQRAKERVALLAMRAGLLLLGRRYL